MTKFVASTYAMSLNMRPIHWVAVKELKLIYIIRLYWKPYLENKMNCGNRRIEGP